VRSACLTSEYFSFYSCSSEQRLGYEEEQEALGSGLRCVSLFTCTSPWEICDYGLQEKIVSPSLEKFFYKRGYNRSATTAIAAEKVRDAVMAQLDALATRAR
jgi:hypothetical protein